MQRSWRTKGGIKDSGAKAKGKGFRDQGCDFRVKEIVLP
jgi:hypothetical protein